MSTTTLMTVDQFVELPDDEHDRYELVEGELIAVASQKPRQSFARDLLLIKLGGYLEHTGWGVTIAETDCRTTGDTVRRPDLAVYAIERWNTIDLDDLPIPFSPDIAIEVVSPSEKFIELEAKAREYLSSGSQEVWLVDALNRGVHVRTRSAVRLLLSGDKLESELLPGFSVLVEDVIRR